VLAISDEASEIRVDDGETSEPAVSDEVSETRVEDGETSEPAASNEASEVWAGQGEPEGGGEEGMALENVLLWSQKLAKVLR
jgi:hypothetical protein